MNAGITQQNESCLADLCIVAVAVVKADPLAPFDSVWNTLTIDPRDGRPSEEQADL